MLALGFFNALIAILLLLAMSPLAQAKESDLCSAIAKLSNTGKLERRFVKARSSDMEGAYKLLRRQDIDIYPDIRFWHADIDGYGIADTIVETHGQQVSARLYWRKGGSNSPMVELEGEDNEVMLSLARFRGQYYVVGYAWRDALTKVWSFEKDMSFVEVCSFQQKPAPKAALTIGASLPLCKAIQNGEGLYSVFSEHPSPINLPDKDIYWAKRALPRMAIADIDNDGHADHVIRLNFFPGNGRQCDSVFFSVINAEGQTVLDNRVNQTLLMMDACVPSPDQLRILAYGDAVYIDAQGWIGDRDVYHLKNGKLEKDCRFLGKHINEPVR